MKNKRINVNQDMAYDLKYIQTYITKLNKAAYDLHWLLGEFMRKNPSIFMEDKEEKIK